MHYKSYNEFKIIYDFDFVVMFKNNNRDNNFEIAFNFNNKKFENSKTIDVIQTSYVEKN